MMIDVATLTGPELAELLHAIGQRYAGEGSVPLTVWEDKDSTALLVRLTVRLKGEALAAYRALDEVITVS